MVTYMAMAGFFLLVGSLPAAMLWEYTNPTAEVVAGDYSPGETIMTLEGGHAVTFEGRFGASVTFAVYGPDGLDRNVKVSLGGNFEHLSFNGVGGCYAFFNANGTLHVVPDYRK